MGKQQNTKEKDPDKGLTVHEQQDKKAADINPVIVERDAEEPDIEKELTSEERDLGRAFVLFNGDFSKAAASVLAPGTDERKYPADVGKAFEILQRPHVMKYINNIFPKEMFALSELVKGIKTATPAKISHRDRLAYIHEFALINDLIPESKGNQSQTNIAMIIKK